MMVTWQRFIEPFTKTIGPAVSTAVVCFDCSTICWCRMLHKGITFIFIASFVLIAGCGQPRPSELFEKGIEADSIAVESDASASPYIGEDEVWQPLYDPENTDKISVLGVKKDRALCYDLQPAAVSTGKKKKKGTEKVSCCQPQSLIYARCRTGMMSCRLGDTSPVQWFSCAKKMGNAVTVPAGGTVMVLDVNPRRKMYTGHPVYVENAMKNGNGTWLLRVSHTNYDRQCHLDEDARVIYDPQKMTASFQTGPWGSWAHDLRVLGFIVR